VDLPAAAAADAAAGEQYPLEPLTAQDSDHESPNDVIGRKARNSQGEYAQKKMEERKLW
jgi:hypothetical protein